MTMPEHRQQLIDTYRQQSAEQATHLENELEALNQAHIRLRDRIRRAHTYATDVVSVYNTFHQDAGKIVVNALFDDEEGEYITHIHHVTKDTQNALERDAYAACDQLWNLITEERELVAKVARKRFERDGADSRLALFAEWEEGRR